MMTLKEVIKWCLLKILDRESEVAATLQKG